MDRDLRKRPVLLLLAIVIAIAADTSFQSAHAQCAPTDKIYIDPRLVPQRQHMSPDTFYHTTGDFDLDYFQKQVAANIYFNQYQPIQIPFNGGIVVVSPNDPCVQQYIGR